jgi:hypothetical protein
MTVRNEILEILETIAKDGLPGPRDLDVALDAIFATIGPDIERARSIAADYCRECRADGWAKMYESGQWDNQPYVVIALRAMNHTDD